MAPETNQTTQGEAGLLDIEIGVTGLKQFSGYIDEEKLNQLRGFEAVRVYREMMDNDATIGAIFFAIEMMIRRVKWFVEPASESPEDVDNEEFLESCLHDMSHSWEDTIAEILSMMGYGWHTAEIIYKRRIGPTESDPTNRSRFTDGKIGWRKLAPRSQDSLQNWLFDRDGGVQGWWQLPPDGSGLRFIPIEKALLFRTTSKKNNPEGRSLLRNCYTAWYHKKEMQRIEGVGAERDLAGLPMLYLPPDMLDPNASPAVKATLQIYKNILKNIRNDEQASVIFPAIFDAAGNRLVEFSLVGTGSRRQFDTGGIIERYTKDIAMSLMADVILLGHEGVGSYALSSSKTQLFSYALGTILDTIATVMNRYAIPRLFRVNGIEVEELPCLKHGDIEKDDVVVIANAIAQLVAAGGITPGGEKDENWFRELLGMPAAEIITPPVQRDPITGLPVPNQGNQPVNPAVPPKPGEKKPTVTVIPDEEPDEKP